MIEDLREIEELLADAAELLGERDRRIAEGLKWSSESWATWTASLRECVNQAHERVAGLTLYADISDVAPSLALASESPPEP